MRKYLLLAPALLLVGCESTTKKVPDLNPQISMVGPSVNNPIISRAEETPLKQEAYRFQHRFLPNIVFAENSTVLDDLKNGQTASLLKTAESQLGSEYAKEIVIEKLEDLDGVLIRMPAPESVPLCYYIAIARVEGSLRFVTLEKTVANDRGVKTCLCEWTKDKKHINKGGRVYNARDQFIKDVMALFR